MKSIVIIQARTNSSRLPAKVLLPIHGIPIVVLATHRASNTGKEVIVATSDEASDDALISTLQAHRINYFRGSLNNTLKRFVTALSNFDDETIVFRLTADNVFPDGQLLDEIEADFVKHKHDYLCCNGELSGLPYGMSVEITYLKHLREASKLSKTTFDQEHVTPYIQRKFGTVFFVKYKNLGKGLHRCTVDYLDDYLRIQSVFSKIDNPITVSAFELIDQLENLKDKPIAKQPSTKLVIGGAQLGLNYGITNKTGQPSDNESSNILKTAINNGSQYVDTAKAYGNSEEIIGKILSNGWESRLHVITKLSPLSECPENATSHTIDAYVEASIYQSCINLKRQSLDVLMLHRISHIDEWNGQVWKRLIQFQESKVINILGASVQSPQELEQALKEPLIEFIQLPFNILDNRWETSIQKIEKVKTEQNLTIHIRSSLLQGILCSENLKYWENANIKDAKPIIEWLSQLTKKHNYSNVVDLCLAYVRSQPWVDGVVVGMETLSQLNQNIQYFDSTTLDESILKDIDSHRPSLSENFLNPSLWNAN